MHLHNGESSDEFLKKLIDEKFIPNIFNQF